MAIGSPKQVKGAPHRCLCWSSLGFLTVSAQPSHLLFVSPSPLTRKSRSTRRSKPSTHWNETIVIDVVLDMRDLLMRKQPIDL